MQEWLIVPSLKDLVYLVFSQELVQVFRYMWLACFCRPP